MDHTTRLSPALNERYRAERELGRGGMATVYLARDLRHDRLVALKLLHPELAASIGPERFLREIRTTAQLQHPHILALFDSGEADGQLWYAMPFVEGESLRDRLTRQIQLPLDEALRIARDIAGALDYAHKHGIIHRDIKPENILLADGHALVADFGIARAVSEAGAAQLTETGLTVGTARYMSPEQASGERTLDGRTDIYSLASVLFEMLAGEPPFTGPTAQAVIAKRFTQAPPRIRTVRETIPASVELAITKALAKTPADRYATAAEFARALEAPVSHPTATTARPRRGIRLALVALIVAVVAGGGTVLWNRLGADRAPITSLAVLPLASPGADSSDEYLSEGLTETLINNLSVLPQLKVSPRSTVFYYKPRDLSPLEVGKKLGVAAVLTWNMRRHGSDLLIQAELLKVSDASRLWGGQYDRPFADVLVVQEEIARTITERLKLQFTGEQSGQLAQHPTRNAQAYDLYARGRYLWLHGLSTSRAMYESSRPYFEQAIAVDSTFALAWSGLADFYSASIGQGFLPVDGYAKADTLARRALQLDPDLAEAHNSLTAVNYFYTGNWDEAERQSRAAITLNPTYGAARVLYGQVLASRGRLAEARTELTRALGMEPYSAVSHIKLGETLQLSGEMEEAVQEYLAALRLAPNSMLAADRLARAYAAQRKYADAVKVRADALRSRGDAERAAAYEAAFRSVGESAGYAKAEKLLAEYALTRLEQRAKTEKVEAEEFLHAYARAGDWNRAMEFLQRVAREHPGRVAFLLTEMGSEPLRALPAGSAMWQKLGLPVAVRRL